MTEKRERQQAGIEAVKTRIKQQGEVFFLEGLEKHFKLLHGIVSDEDALFGYYSDDSVRKHYVERKLLSCMIPLFLNQYGCPIHSYEIETAVELSGSEDADNMANFERMIEAYRMNAHIVELFGFDYYFVIWSEDDEAESIRCMENIPHDVLALVSEQIQDFFRQYCYADAYILYHPHYFTICNWAERNRMDLPSSFWNLLKIVKIRLENMTPMGTEPIKAQDGEGAAFLLLFTNEDELLYSDQLFMEESLFASFALQCLELVAVEFGYPTIGY